MSRNAARITSLPLLLGVLALVPATPAWASDQEPAATGSEEPGDTEDDALRERLTEREDKRRPLEPWSVQVAGRPLIVGGEIEIVQDSLRRFPVDDPARRVNRSLSAQELEVEAFYSLGRPLSLFAQVRTGIEEVLRPDTSATVSNRFVERGEMWLYSEHIAGSNLSLDLGRLDFEDDRRWWWDEELDAIRVEYEAERFDLALAFARELAPSRSDRDFVDPQHDRVHRVIAEASWGWRRNHVLQLFALHQDDRSHREFPGRVVQLDREDESDARLTWVGARLMGGIDFGAHGMLGYWLDAAQVRGKEHLAEFETLDWNSFPVQQSIVASVSQQDVRGWAMDAGLNWILPLAWEPRLIAGIAFGTGDRNSDDGADYAFRQTGLHANEAGFGGVQRYGHYGVLLDPELSNLQVLTFGAGLTLLQSSSLDLVHHRYRLVEPATSLRDARLDVALTGTHRELGSGIDAVLALEEWERFEFEFVAAAFRAGPAFGSAEGSWSYGGFLALRIAF
ncbi:alginate export family protein [Lysobacter sp. CFH 32150]|uniref:alginate export family protein n=1 Tax=Lysobacter sp. CFH 32150 TaxID=2927128 RepID=UPI001FA6CDDC|nr:alginate export family protein [Lysobacter sp. CFH 32150]MCI4567070.1 alginate export family protein [Lysobacter sp. CFH 32150]